MGDGYDGSMLDQIDRYNVFITMDILQPTQLQLGLCKN
jgi:hypothetical protein